jgi:predicted ABC-type transport system involved in lysophospholipase L1 biosynthesis ATPase subunit
MVTHEPALAERAQRNIHVRDGQVYLGESEIHLAVQTA